VILKSKKELANIRSFWNQSGTRTGKLKSAFQYHLSEKQLKLSRSSPLVKQQWTLICEVSNYQQNLTLIIKTKFQKKKIPADTKEKLSSVLANKTIKQQQPPQKRQNKTKFSNRSKLIPTLLEKRKPTSWTMMIFSVQSQEQASL
jgi:DNA gyrase/topoisomerase IV subunit B